MRRFLKGQPDPIIKADKLEKLAKLVDLWVKDEIDLRFADESGFSLTPSVPYGWSLKGQQIGRRSEKKLVTNVFGLMSPDNQLTVYQTPKTIDSVYICHCMDDFANQCFLRDKISVVVWDNASWHKAQLVKDKIAEWEAKGLFVFNLPTYSAHLNKIETLWRKIKYEWLENKDYLNFDTLKNALNNIFENFGSLFSIAFSLNY